MASSIVTAPGAQNLARNPIWVTLESDHMAGASPPYVPDVDNLSCHLEVWRYIPVDVEERLALLSGPYDNADKRITFNIADLFPRTTSLPTAISLGVSPTDPYWGEALGLTNIFRLKHADQYGDPVTTDALNVSDDYLAINGGLPADAIQSVNLSLALIGLHSYYFKRDSAFVFRKPVSMNQPDYVYFIALVTGDIDVVVTRNYDDGASDYFTALTIPVTTNKAYWVQAGYNQLKAYTDPLPDKTIVGYQVSLIYGIQNAFTAFYVLDDMCPSWEKYILFHNGFGGYETVRMKGKTKYTHRVNRETFRRTRWIDFDISVGDTEQIRTLGGAVFNTHTGHYPAYYVEHLRQLLHGKMWLIDLDLAADLNQYRFKRIMCETDSVDIRTDDPGPDGFAITYTHAWQDDGFNIY